MMLFFFFCTHGLTPIPSPQQDLEDSDYQDMSMSITSSIRAYRTINGRTYHAERGNANYWAANDEQQLDSMDLYAHLCYLLNGHQLYRAPLDPNTLHRALDIGTGTGVWAIDFADAHPGCEVVGTDISPIQPDWVPENLKL
jgi:SAM-dependent methyltransferase